MREEDSPIDVEEIDTDNADDITCPWCGQTHSDEDPSDRTETWSCESCEKEFTVDRDYSVSYTMEPVADGFEYIRRAYGVDPVVGQRVTVDGKRGVINAAGGAYIKVRFADRDYDVPCHPTWEVEYGPKPEAT